MSLLAVTLIPGGLLAWIVVGLIAGAVAGRIARGRGFGCLGDIIVGLLGSVVGGFIVDNLIHGSQVYHFWGSVLVALLGALVLLFVLRLLRSVL